MTNNEMLLKMKQYDEEVKKMKNDLNVKLAEADALMSKFLGVDPGTNLSLIEVLEKVYNKIHD